MGRPERPVDPENGPVQRFAWELRQLREQAESPGYRQLARKAHYSATTLSEAAGGERLPSLAVTQAYVQACDGDVAMWQQRWRRAASQDIGQASCPDCAPRCQPSGSPDGEPVAGRTPTQRDSRLTRVGRAAVVSALTFLAVATVVAMRRGGAALGGRYGRRGISGRSPRVAAEAGPPAGEGFRGSVASPRHRAGPVATSGR